MARNARGGVDRRTLLETTLGLGTAAALGGVMPGRGARADTPTLNMWWWGEQELPGLQSYVDDSVKAYTAATVKPMLQDTAVSHLAVPDRGRGRPAARHPVPVERHLPHGERLARLSQPAGGHDSRRDDQGVESDPA